MRCNNSIYATGMGAWLWYGCLCCCMVLPFCKCKSYGAPSFAVIEHVGRSLFRDVYSIFYEAALHRDWSSHRNAKRLWTRTEEGRGLQPLPRASLLTGPTLTPFVVKKSSGFQAMPKENTFCHRLVRFVRFSRLPNVHTWPRAVNSLLHETLVRQLSIVCWR